MIYESYAYSIQFLESLTTADLEGLDANQGCLSVFTNDKGGIIDDLIVTKVTDECAYMVTNAGCIDKDYSLLMVGHFLTGKGYM